MKTTIKTNSNGSVTVSYDSTGWRGEDVRVERTFFCPTTGGYVREYDDKGQYPQVCDGLSNRGSTLDCPSRAKLPDMIRREYRAMRRAEKREYA